MHWSVDSCGMQLQAGLSGCRSQQARMHRAPELRAGTHFKAKHHRSRGHTSRKRVAVRAVAAPPAVDEADVVVIGSGAPLQLIFPRPPGAQHLRCAQWSMPHHTLRERHAGIGGLCCAALLAHYGKRVTVVESHYHAGGAAHGFDVAGYNFDAGPSFHAGLSVDKSSNPLKQVLDIIGERVECVTYDRWIVYDDRGTFPCIAGVEGYHRNILEQGGERALQEWKALEKEMAPLQVCQFDAGTPQRNRSPIVQSYCLEHEDQVEITLAQSALFWTWRFCSRCSPPAYGTGASVSPDSKSTVFSLVCLVHMFAQGGACCTWHGEP